MNPHSAGEAERGFMWVPLLVSSSFDQKVASMPIQ